MIEVDGLTKYYGEHAAIRDLKFSIDRGEVIGFLGLNGAGKSTTLKILGCVLLPTSGRVVIDGIDIAEDPHAIRRRIGYLPDVPPLYNEMTVAGYLRFVAELRGVGSADVGARVEEAARKTNLADHSDAPIGSLSHGYRQRVGLAQALVHKPHLLILDEPTSGLDPVQIVEMRQLIRNLKGEHTVLLSSHILSEISQTCDRLLVIDGGEIVAQGSESDISSSVGSVPAVEIELVAGAAWSTPAVLELLRGIDGVADARLTRNEGGVALLALSVARDVRPAVTRALVGAGLDVLRIDRGGSQLEQIFMKLTRTKGGEA